MNDDELLARLRSADPALTSSAPPPDINRLVEATLNTDTDTALQLAETAADTTTRPAKAAGRGRRHLLGLAAAAGLLMLGGSIAGGIVANNDDGHSISTGPLNLTAESGSANRKCMEPVPDQLRKYPTLFEGTVTSIKGSMVTFRVDHWLQGGDADTVVLDSNTDQPETLTFTDGEHYIVAAENGVVPSCGANWASAETISKFRQAYGN
ncbi:hypothetical protein OHT59_22280 [Streptomyces sp. NBC_00243]|uniref:hypothetical protein n=1 Tax=Streptomyces sp. NBC_00243 TaxID=2975688 RepID=UPI002DD926EE|nr:hypothetical protein [Streptomyces sp. NBC_00243]WRZ21033.1 hypothetical protein OHT59_22280 [Streptomyces sp. NBC_00243]